MDQETKSATWRQVAIVFGVATLLALFFVTKFYYGWRAAGIPTTWTKHLWWQAMEWYSWAAFLPLIFWICRKLDMLSRRWLTIVLHLLAGSLFALVHCAILTSGARIEAWVLASGKSWGELLVIVLRNHLHSNLFTYAAIGAVWHAMNYYRKVREHEAAGKELEKSLAQARLQALRTQFQPHFLFNTLNSISALNHEDPKAANRMIARLSELLRLSLENDGAQEITLRQELEFLRGYLEIQGVRFGHRLTVRMDADLDTMDAMVPNLLLQPLVENAIHHGIAPFSGRGEIHVTAHREHEALRLQVTDNGPGIEAARLNDLRGGVGLENTRARLRQLYGQAQTLELRNGNGRGLTVEVRIPYVEAAKPRKQ
jgi:two-component system LytT family sensor kinase